MKKIISKIIGLVRLEVPEKSKSNRWYAHCYYDFNRYTSVCYIVPINYLVRLICRLDYFWFKHVIRSESGLMNCKINAAYQAGLDDGRNTKRVIGILAGNHSEFVLFLKENKVYSRHLFVYIYSVDQLICYRFLCFIRIGTWYKRNNYLEIEKAVGY